MTYTQAGQELVRALDFKYLKKNFRVFDKSCGCPKKGGAN